MNIRRSVFWQFESETERLLLAFAVLGTVCRSIPQLRDAAILLPVMAFLLLYGAMHTAGRIFARRWMAAGAQVVTAGVLLAAFHEVPQGGIQSLFLEEGAQSGLLHSQLLPSIGIAAGACLVLYYLFLFLGSFPWMMRAALVLTDAAVIVMALRGAQPAKFSAGVLILLTLLEGQRTLEWAMQSAHGVHSLRWLVCFAALELAVLCLPVRSTPIDWSFVLRIGARIRDGVETITADTGYLLSEIGSGDSYASGYSGLGSAGSRTRSSERAELYLQTIGTRDNLYLTGVIHGSDEDNAQEIEGRWFLDYLLALYAHDVTRDEARLFGRVYRAEIEYGYLRTEDVIRPSHVLQIGSNVKKDLDESGRRFSRQKRKGYRYETVYLDVDYGSRYLAKIMQTPVQYTYPDYEELQVYARKLYDIQLNLTVTEAEYRRWIQDQRERSIYLDERDYLSGARTLTGKVPAGLIKGAATIDTAATASGVETEDSGKGTDLADTTKDSNAAEDETGYATPRMRELAQTLTGEAATQYEACRAVERYLRQYHYGQGAVNEEDGNFIDRFLFETGEGYCVHYAASMVMLLRLSGIPARYVEGYCYTFPEIKSGTYTVTGSSAHAWPEAYLEGFGWVPFEPTAIKRTSLESGWNLYLPEDDPALATGEPGIGAGLAGEDEDYDEPELPEVPELPDMVGTSAALEDADKGEAASGGPGMDLQRLLRTGGWILLGLAGYLLLMLAMRVLLRVIRFQKAGLGKKYELLLQDIRWLTLRYPAASQREDQIPGDPMTGSPDHEMLESLARRLPNEGTVPGDHLDTITPRALAEKVVCVYYRQRFAGRTATGQEVRDAQYLRAWLRLCYYGNGVGQPLRLMQYLLRSDR